MARTKGDLIKEAVEKGIPLTGEEQIVDLKQLLKAHGDTAAELEGDEAGGEGDEAEPEDRFPGVTPDTHIAFEGSDDHIEYDNKARDRRININGANYEHVHDHPVTGCWVYRQFPG